MAPMEEIRWVIRATRQPMRVAAAAASQPAWPPPMTIRSKRGFGRMLVGRGIFVYETRRFDGRNYR